MSPEFHWINAMLVNCIRCYRYRVPFRIPVHVGNLTLTYREGLLLQVGGDSGQMGWGEAAPLPGLSGESIEDVAQRLRSIAPYYLGEIADPVTCPPESARVPSVLFALETALMHLRQVSTFSQTDPPQSRLIPVCALADGSISNMVEKVHASLHAGFTAIKIKVGLHPLQDDIVLVREMLGAVQGKCTLRLDANRRWNHQQYLSFCDGVGRHGIEFVEEPVNDAHCINYHDLYMRTGLFCAVDETLQELSRCLYAHEGAGQPVDPVFLHEVIETAQVWVWKPSVCMPPKHLNLKNHAPLVLSAAYETGIGTAAIAAYASSSGNAMAVGIDTYSRLESDILDKPLNFSIPHLDLGCFEASQASVDIGRLHLLWEKNLR